MLRFVVYDPIVIRVNNISGDQVSRRGALTGGYYDTRKSRLDLQKGKTETQRGLQLEEREYENHKAKLLNILSDGCVHVLLIWGVCCLVLFDTFVS